MPRAGTPLDSGEALPRLTVSTLDHGELVLPDHFGDGYGLLIVYRGHW